MFLLPPSPTGLNTEGIYRVSGNKAEMESMQRQFEQGYPSFWASAVFPPVSFWNLQYLNQNCLGNKESAITKQDLHVLRVGVISSNQLCRSHPVFLNSRKVLAMFMQFFRRNKFTFLCPITLSCVCYMITIASAGQCSKGHICVCGCVLGWISNKCGST